MSWQILIWNIFIWTFMGLMIHFNSVSMWWLLIPVLFTGYNSARDLMKYNEMKEKQTEEETIKRLEEMARRANIKL